jgi:hypothetical protein
MQGKIKFEMRFVQKPIKNMDKKLKQCLSRDAKQLTTVRAERPGFRYKTDTPNDWMS